MSGRWVERRRARALALQMLYQWEVGKLDIDRVLRTFGAYDVEPASADATAYARWLASGTVEAVERLDARIVEATEHWRLSRLAVIDRLVLRLATFELLESKDTPPNVVLDEALELTRTYSSEEAVAFVNGVLDHIKRAIESPSS